MERLSGLIIRFRWSIIVFTLLITIALGYQITKIRINSDVINSLPDDDPHASLFKDIGERFGGNKIGMIILQSDNIFQPEVLGHIGQITDSLQMMEGISSVTSITNIVSISGGDEGLEVGKLIDEYNLPQTEDELATLKEKALSEELYKGFIISADGKSSIIMFTMMESADAGSLAKRIKEMIADMQLPEQIYYAGSPMLVSAISKMISADLYKLIPISFLVIALVLFLGFSTKRGVILPLLNSAIAIVWTIGIMALGRFELTMISNNIPILLLAIGSAYVIHVLNRISLYKEMESHKAISQALTYIFIPVLLAALTTMVGFISFIFGSYLTMIRDFGLFTALGTLFSVVLSLFFIPAVVSFLKNQYTDSAKTPTNNKSQLTSMLLQPMAYFLFKHPKYTLTAWTAMIIISFGGIFLVERNVNIQDYFKPGNPARTAEEIMVRDFGGTKPVFVLFTGDMQNPEVLKTMLECEEYMKKSPDILTTQSVASLIARLYEGFGEGEGIPDDQETIEQLWFLIDGNEMLERMVTENLDQGIIISKFISSDDEAKRAFEDYMERFVQENKSEDFTIQFTGMPFIDVTMNNSLLKSQIGSLTIAIIFVVIIVGLIFRSLLKGLLATIPMIAAIIILFGVMGLSGIPLNIATVLVASIAIGIGIDYSIHVISNVNYWLKRGEDINKAIEDTVLVSGKAIIINMFSVTAGFLVLIFSEMLPLQYFGLLIGLSMIGSSLGALTLLPVILILINKKKTNHKAL